MAVYEIYVETTHIRRLRPIVFGAVAGGFAVLFFPLLVFMLRAAARIRRQQAERERLAKQLGEFDAVRELSRVKDEELMIASHELRAPLTSIVGYAELLLKRDLAESQRWQFLAVIYNEGLRLAMLVNDLLDLQRLETGHERVNPTPTDLRLLLAEAVAAAGDDRCHALVVDLPGEPPLAQADAGRVRQVLVNLISNARQYSPSGGEVRLSARVVDGAVEVSVSDQGLGIPSEALPRLFDKLYRVDASDRSTIKGSGLGLAIVKQIVVAHGGRVWAESAGLGTGARFCFTLPIAQPVAHSSALPDGPPESTSA